MSEKDDGRLGNVVRGDGRTRTLVVPQPGEGERPWTKAEAKKWLMKAVEEAIDHDLEELEDLSGGFSLIMAPWLTIDDFCMGVQGS